MNSTLKIIWCLWLAACARPATVAPTSPAAPLPAGLAAPLASLVGQTLGTRMLETSCLGAFSADPGGELAFVARDADRVTLYVATLAPAPAVQELRSEGVGAPTELQCLTPAAVVERNALIQATETVSGQIELPPRDALCASDASGTRFNCFGLVDGVWRSLGGWMT